LRYMPVVSQLVRGQGHTWLKIDLGHGAGVVCNLLGSSNSSNLYSVV